MSTQELKIAQLSAARGQRTYGIVSVNMAGHVAQLPLFLINGTEDGPTLVVTAGVHGAEYASIEAALRLGRVLDPQHLRGRVIVLPIVDMPAYTARAIYICPLDGKNPNRVFPGKPDGTASEQLADWVLKNVISQGNFYVDLHGGDLNEALVPFTVVSGVGTPEVNAQSMALARAFGIRYISASEVVGSTISSAAKAGIPGILPESGGQGIWRAEHIHVLSDGLDRVMRHLGMLAGPPVEERACVVMSQSAWLRSEHTGCWYPGVEVDQHVKKGDLLGWVTDFDGKRVQEAISPIDGVVIFAVSTLAINTGDPLLAVAN